MGAKNSKPKHTDNTNQEKSVSPVQLSSSAAIGVDNSQSAQYSQELQDGKSTASSYESAVINTNSLNDPGHFVGSVKDKDSMELKKSVEKHSDEYLKQRQQEQDNKIPLPVDEHENDLESYPNSVVQRPRGMPANAISPRGSVASSADSTEFFGAAMSMEKEKDNENGGHSR